ncbi:hypothetical protein NC651_034768 [Populus alba x Populus x berolinensis]|nr:hypothetical protein NC651_034768 [Populus alba x Populus x berolinensis]
MSGGTRNLLIIVGVNTTAISWTVKKSYYGFSIDCNDDGALVFIEALDGGDVTKVFQEADINQLLPCSPYGKSFELSTDSSYLGAMTAVTGEIEATKINAATIAVHVRRRMKPPVPQQSIGNFYLVATAN